MRKLLWLLAVVCCTASVAMAGPNAGGIMVVHDTGLAYSTDTVLPPVSEPPVSCGSLDLQIDPGFIGIWKVYAIFPAGSSPRLKGLSWGIGISANGGGGVSVQAAGLPSAADFELTQGGWPNTSGAGVGMSFTSGTKTGLITECYWFAGYGYLGGAGETQTFCVQQHPVQPPMFVDDAVPANQDSFADKYGCLGFGALGSAPCPPEPGACCIYDEAGTCLFILPADCQLAGGTFVGGACTPGLCPQLPPPGSCCYHDGTCQITTEAACTGTWTYHGECVPNVCVQPDGACCTGAPDWLCTITKQIDCAALWIMDGVCLPAPGSCPPEPQGSCCYHDGTCSITTLRGCTGTFTEGGVCVPNTCVQPDGACCAPYACSITKAADCVGLNWQWFMDGVCDPTPCPPPPAEAACCIAGWVNGQLNWCVITVQADCMLPNVWHQESPTCDPLPCHFVPTEQKTWGEIKNIYR